LENIITEISNWVSLLLTNFCH